MPRSVAEKSKTDTFEPAAGESERLRVVESPAKPRPAPEPQPEPEPRPQAEPQPQPETPPEARDGKPEPAKKKGAARRFVLPVIGLVALAAGGYYGYHYWVDGRFMVGTDDAYVEADISYVAPKLAGYVAAVPVKENQHVKAGDVLLRLDDGDYRIALAQAEAQIATQHKTVERIAAQAEAADAQLEQAKAHRQASTATLSNAERTAARADQLVKTRVGTQAQLDDARTALDQAKAGLAGDDASIAAANANVGVLEAQRVEAASLLQSLELARQKAERDLGFTVLKATFDGVVGNVAVEQGDMIAVGQKLAALVPVDRLYVVANFKETQLARLVPGQTVKLAVDAADGETLTGRVSSLAPASGAVFSLLPPENATGNFTKVVQRVPVRIDVSDKDLARGILRAGLSVVVSVDSRTAPAASR